MNIHDALKRSLHDSDMDAEVIAEIDDTFNPMGPYGKLFSGLETNYLQTKYYHNFFGLVVSHEYHQPNSAVDWCNLLQDPKTVVLGTVRKAKGTGMKRHCVEVEETMQYIPIMDTLNVLLQMRQLTLRYNHMLRCIHMYTCCTVYISIYHHVHIMCT